MEYTGFKVLVVDDVEKNLQIIGSLLQDRGISISFALDGKQALMAAEKKLPDLILLDISMPEMDGFEVCEKIKSADETNNIPIIFLSARNETQDIVKGFAYGAVDYITKPFNKEELISRVFTHLELKKSRDIISSQYEKLNALNAKIFEHTRLVEKLNTTLSNKNIELNELNASKDKFFSIISHDLKGPLSNVLGFSELLLKQLNKTTDENLMKFGSLLRDSTQNTFNLIENLLEWSRSQTGKINFVPQKVNLRKLIKDILSLYTESIASKSILIKYDISNELCVFVDKNMISTVLRNLISNAVKFTPKGGSINISYAELIKNDKTFVVVNIKDSGIGMNAKTKGELFKIDEGVSLKGTEGEMGTGLGLILCKDFIEKNTGEIWVESEPDEGSTFSFTVPAYNLES